MTGSMHKKRRRKKKRKKTFSIKRRKRGTRRKRRRKRKKTQKKRASYGFPTPTRTAGSSVTKRVFFPRFQQTFRSFVTPPLPYPRKHK